MSPDVRDHLIRLVHRGIRLCKWTLCAVIILFGVKYCFEARARHSADNETARWWTDVSTQPDWNYTAKSTFISHDTILLRLYKTGDPTILAERTYTEHGVNLFWTRSGWLIYDTSDESYLGGGIQLPPTRLDRFLAKLP